MTAEDFRRQEAHLLDWIQNAHDDKERQAAHLTLNNLHQMRMRQAMLEPVEEKPKRKPRKLPTKVELFDKKNSRREAIMAQRARSG